MFSFGLSGVVIADYGGESIFDTPFTELEQDNMAATNVPANDRQVEEDNINPLFCTEDLVKANEHAKNDCTQDDLDINIAG